MVMLWALWLGCAEDGSDPAGPSRGEASSRPSAPCSYRDVWFDLADAPSMEEERGFDAAGRPVWHAADGVVTTTWSYDAEGRPAAMQLGDPLAPDVEQAYSYDADGRLDRVFLGAAGSVQFTWGGDGQLLQRDELDANGASVETTRWTYDGGTIVSWELERGGGLALTAARDTFEDGVSYVELQDDLASGTWLQLLEVFGPDGAPYVAEVSTEQGLVSHTWTRSGEDWVLRAVWATTGADWVWLEDQVVYRFDERGREVSRAVEGEGASPFQRRERTWDCDVDVQEAFVPPLLQRPVVFYVSPIYVTPPLAGDRL